MSYRDIAKVLSRYLLFFVLILLVPFSVSVYDHLFIHTMRPNALFGFAITLGITLATSSLFAYWGRHAKGEFYRREGILSVVLVWIISALLGAIPFYASGTLDNFAKALFESTSAFTTTGATVMEAKEYDDKTGQEVMVHNVYLGLEEVVYDYYGTIIPVLDAKGDVLYEGIEAVCRSLLLWRSFMQWLGGGGILVLFVTVLPALGVGGKILLQSEVTGPIKDNLTPRIQETAMSLWRIYVFLTMLEIFSLLWVSPNISFFDAVLVSFSTISTGGMSAHNDSVAFLQHPLSYWVILCFMILGSTNFSLYFFCLRGRFFKLRDLELFSFLLIIIALAAFSIYSLTGVTQVHLDGMVEGPMVWSQALLYGLFQLVSAMTSTGFSITNYEVWPFEFQVVMLMVMYIGGMSGSTAGGLKLIRHLLLCKITQTKVESLFRPEAVHSIRIANREVGTHTQVLVLCFFFTVIAFSVLAIFLFTSDGIDPETALSLTASLLNNTGISFRQAGVNHSFAFLSDFSTLTSCVWMLLGRLEFFAVLVLFIPRFWMDKR